MPLSDQKLKDNYLLSMGIQPWKLRSVETTVSSTTHPTLEPHSSRKAWEILEREAKACVACELHRTRTQVVFGVGNQQANLLIVGEAPGQQEDLKGEPFVGRAGKLLDEMLRAIFLKREAIYIANILKCRPPGNRDPKIEEVDRCTTFLERQVALLKPKIILALGRFAAHYLLNTTTALSRLRTQTHRFRDTNIPLIVSYHPAYLLRNPSDKAKSYVDLLKVKNLLETLEE